MSEKYGFLIKGKKKIKQKKTYKKRIKKLQKALKN